MKKFSARSSFECFIDIAHAMCVSYLNVHMYMIAVETYLDDLYSYFFCDFKENLLAPFLYFHKVEDFVTIPYIVAYMQFYARNDRATSDEFHQTTSIFKKKRNLPLIKLFFW